MGIELAAQAGYDPAAALTLWEKMSNASGQKSRGDFWSTHPSPPNRIDALQALQEPMKKIYEERKIIYQGNYIPSFQYVRAGNEGIGSSSNVSGLSLASDTSQDNGNALAFYSPQYVAFKDGKLELTCTDCRIGFIVNQGKFKELYEKQDWRGLEQNIAKVGLKIDLAYLYLGFSADGMGLTEQAKVYFSKALELSNSEEYSCHKSMLIKCNDFDVGVLSRNKLKSQ